MVLVGCKAPDFTSAAVLGNGEIINDFNFFEFTKGKKSVLFFYPMDFTFVCPSELIAFDKRFHLFKEKGVEVIGVSIDSQFSHNAWRKIAIKDGGIGPVKYPLVADIKHEICKGYGVEYSVEGVAFRASFLIDENQIIRHQVINDLPLGRDIDEMLRMVDALNFHEQNGEVCPAQWKEGKTGMKASPIGVAQFLSKYIKDLDR
ncbi:peroxiredoxin [Candidatus Photodesmus katoptron]|uniref:Thioredoxin peroxidase n=1 Tax=Candidatus Photodesmus katoptron Akat1 TaxID=1236703 RepID=S3DJQ0_9GAMM|nr:peroxiredoxin C [Candidatus Photodesmus katoptron]EPE37940.1 ahpC/TSA protein [Candidatus Photodesmus katoptron Akat1]KEY90273.1 peroxiredoxin [Candidatus Photodesmus katoptron]